jgi:hypothetical protein
MNGLDKPAVFTIAIADLIALASWIPRSSAGFNFNGDGSSDRQPQFLALPGKPPGFPERAYTSAAVPSFSICDDRVAVALAGSRAAKRWAFSRRSDDPINLEFYDLTINFLVKLTFKI